MFASKIYNRAKHPLLDSLNFIFAHKHSKSCFLLRKYDQGEKEKKEKNLPRASLSFADPGIVCDLSVLHSLRALFIISPHFQQMRAALLFHIQRRGTVIHIPAVGYCGRRISGTNTHTHTSPTARNLFFILTSTFPVH